MRKLMAVGLLIIMALLVACGGDSGSGATGEAKVVDDFMISLVEKGDLKSAYDKLANEDRMMMGMIPGFYDVITGKADESVPEEVRLMQVMLKEIVPIPKNVFDYKLGDPQGEGDTLKVPIDFIYPRENMEEVANKYIDKETQDKLENIDQLDMTFEEKKAMVKDALGKVMKGIRSETFEMDTTSEVITLVKQDDGWRISIMGAMQNFMQM
ncbi:MAG: hypothetical protein GF404_05435 [candidate division Zixibacteria bacterium]|nr:hypothetical protein [candidate division Zixibacteria bacterium]